MEQVKSHKRKRKGGSRKVVEVKEYPRKRKAPVRFISMCAECGKKLPQPLLIELPSWVVIICHNCYKKLKLRKGPSIGGN